MVEMPDEKYQQLLKDADDNRSIRSVMRWIALIFFAILFMAAYGCHAIDMQKRLDNARIEVEVRDIQRGDLEFDEYISWLEAADDNS